jgi:hypothetical protein
LAAPRQVEAGGFEFTVIGPPGTYAVLTSTDLRDWTEAGRVTNHLGRVDFAEGQAGVARQTFYRALHLGSFPQPGE